MILYYHISMSKMISITLPEALFERLERLRRDRGAERSGIIQQALAFYLGTQGPNPKVVRRWKAAYAKAGEAESKAAESWKKGQRKARGSP